MRTCLEPRDGDRGAPPLVAALGAPLGAPCLAFGGGLGDGGIGEVPRLSDPLGVTGAGALAGGDLGTGTYGRNCVSDSGTTRW